MDGIPACRTQTGAGCDAPPAALRFDSARLGGLNISEESTAELEILTAEGDRVSLSAASRTEGALLTYGRLSVADSGCRMEEGELLGFHQEREIKLSVDGDLNEQELSDINALLGDLDRMLQDFLTGKSQASAEPSADFGRFSSLSQVDARMEYHASVEITRLEAQGLSGVRQEADGRGRLHRHPGAGHAGLATPAASPAADAEPAASTPPRQAAPAPAPGDAVSAQESERAAARMARRTARSGIEPHRLFGLLKRFLGRRLDAMKSLSAIDARQAEDGRKVLESFFKRIGPDSGEAEARSGRVSFSQVSLSRSFEFQYAEETRHLIRETA